MANPTSNFGWQMPTNTDLVKDLPADFETFGQAVDTSLADLKGGTTGQILSKNSNTDMDFVWIANDQGDITAVTAGTGLTGGGTAGAVTVSLDSPVAATLGGTAQTSYTTGDLIYASGTNTLAKRAIGTTGQVLTVSGGVPTWAAAAGGSSGPAFKAKKSSNQTITSGAYVKVAYQDEIFDTDSCYDPTTNYRFTPNKAGYYQVTIGYCVNASSASTVITRLYKNGANDTETFSTDGFTGQGIMSNSASLIYLNGSTDYIEVYAYHGGTSPDIKPDASQFSAVWIRS